MGDFNFARHYGAEVKEIKRSGVSITNNLSRVKFHEGDTLVLWADDSFISTWGILLYLYCWLMVKTPNRKVTGKTLVCIDFVGVDDCGSDSGELPLWKNYFPVLSLICSFCGCNDCDNGVDQTFSGT